MTKVMVCGTRKKEDIKLLVEAGVDGIGLITEVWQDIPCNLSRTQSKELSRVVPPLISSVLIITEERVDEICRMVEQICPDILQLHGFNSPEDIATLKKRLKAKIVKVLHFQGEKLAEGNDPIGYARQCIAAGANAILVDSYEPDKVGATGKMICLSIAGQIRDRIYPTPFILSGGLRFDNVARAIDEVAPYAVDAFSGVISNGYLDASKVKQFVAKVHSK
jgi:phosphoribosylanthranilate isomerase